MGVLVICVAATTMMDKGHGACMHARPCHAAARSGCARIGAMLHQAAQPPHDSWAPAIGAHCTLTACYRGAPLLECGTQHCPWVIKDRCAPALAPLPLIELSCMVLRMHGSHQAIVHQMRLSTVTRPAQSFPEAPANRQDRTHVRSLENIRPSALTRRRSRTGMSWTWNAPMVNAYTAVEN